MEKCRIGIIGENNLLTGAILNRLKSWRFPSDVIQVYRHDEQDTFDILEVVKENEILFVCCRCEYIEKLFQEASDAHCLIVDLEAGTSDTGKRVIPTINADVMHAGNWIVRLPQMESLQLILSLYKLYERYTIEEVYVSTYSSLAKADMKACLELRQQMECYLKDEALQSCCMPFSNAKNHLPVLFNPLPQVDAFTKEGYTNCEKRMEIDFQEVLGSHAPVNATCVWIASMRGSSMSIQVKVKEPCEKEAVMDCLSSGGSALLIDDIDHQMYPIASDVIHDYRCFIGRVRLFHEHTIGLWSVCDEIEMVSANAVMVAFMYMNNGWLRK